MYVDYHHNDLAGDEESLQKNLAEAVDFSDGDLAMNKAGKLSSPQMVRLLIRGLGPFLGLLGAAVGLVALGVILWTAGPMIMTRFRLMMGLGKYVVLGLGGLFFGVIALIVKLALTSGRMFQLILDLMEGKATSVSGRMNTSKSEEIEDGLSTITKEKTHTWNCVIKGEYFEITEETFELLQDRSGSNYRAYVTPRSRFLVSMEPSGNEPGTRDPFKMEYSPS